MDPSPHQIVRHWRGLARKEWAAAYEEHLRSETFPALARIEGFLGAEILKRALDTGVEFLIVTRWTSIDAISKFAGDDIEIAVVPPKVRSMMIDYDRKARHYESAAA